MHRVSTDGRRSKSRNSLRNSNHQLLFPHFKALQDEQPAQLTLSLTNTTLTPPYFSCTCCYGSYIHTEANLASTSYILWTGASLAPSGQPLVVPPWKWRPRLTTKLELTRHPHRMQDSNSSNTGPTNPCCAVLLPPSRAGGRGHGAHTLNPRSQTHEGQTVGKPQGPPRGSAGRRPGPGPVVVASALPFCPGQDSGQR